MPSAVLRRFVAGHLGDGLVFKEHTVPYGEALVWSVARDGETLAWLKRHRQKDQARREARAYDQWLPRLSATTAPWMGVCPEVPAALLLGHVEGVPANRARLDDAQVRAMYRGLGAFLAELHGLEVDDDDEMPLHDALDARCERWLSKAELAVDMDLLDEARAALSEPWPATLVRVPCHRDLQWRNVMVRPEGDAVDITVIDFGQSRLDVRFSDFVKLFQLPDELAAGAFRAFFEGYGRRLSRDEMDALMRLRILHGIATWVWSDDHGDTAGVRLGRKIVEDSLDGWRGHG